MKVIPFKNADEAKAFLVEEEKAFIKKAKKIAKKMMLVGLVLITVSAFSFMLDVTAHMPELSMGEFILGFCFLAKGLYNYFTNEADHDDELDFEL